MFLTSTEDLRKCWVAIKTLSKIGTIHVYILCVHLTHTANPISHTPQRVPTSSPVLTESYTAPWPSGPGGCSLDEPVAPPCVHLDRCGAPWRSSPLPFHHPHTAGPCDQRQHRVDLSLTPIRSLQTQTTQTGVEHHEGIGQRPLIIHTQNGPANTANIEIKLDDLQR